MGARVDSVLVTLSATVKKLVVMAQMVIYNAGDNMDEAFVTMVDRERESEELLSCFSNSCRVFCQ